MKKCPASSYSILKRQEAGFTKTASQTLQISIIVVFRPVTVFAKEENNICSRN